MHLLNQYPGTHHSQFPQRQKNTVQCGKLLARFSFLIGLLICLTATGKNTSRAYGDTPANSAFQGNAQWIWEVEKSGNTPENIAAKAKRFGITTVFVKAGDGVKPWNQFANIIAPLKALGIKTCAWQYVYGRKPAAEAKVAARAIQQGADCFVIDAEVEFERVGGYKAARTYITKLRQSVGPQFPIGFSSFPYVNFHPSLPYSAFFEPPYRADINLPQVYWREIGTKVETAMATTYQWNDLYGVPIAPIAGVWRGETANELQTFRTLSAQHKDPGVSYWSWQETRSWQWTLLDSQTNPLQPTAANTTQKYPVLTLGAKGDPVLWLQIQLGKLGYALERSGKFDLPTKEALTQFQIDNNLALSGKTDGTTWPTLNTTAATVRLKKGSQGSKNFREPVTAGLPALRYEISSRGKTKSSFHAP